MPDEPLDFFKCKIVIVHGSTFFTRGDRTAEGFNGRHIDWFIGTVNAANGDIHIARGIDVAKLDAERVMVKEHNRRIELAGDASATEFAKWEAIQAKKAAEKSSAKKTKPPTQSANLA